jgi:hypothetical protein
LPTKELSQGPEETFESLPQVSISEQSAPIQNDGSRNSKYQNDCRELSRTSTRYSVVAAISWKITTQSGDEQIVCQKLAVASQKNQEMC